MIMNNDEINSSEISDAISFLEPEAQKIGAPGNPIRPLISIAISMKRIADSLDRIERHWNK
jgi:hypothetical protein